MIAPEYEQLIQDVLDGIATPEEASRLDRWLQSNEAGRARQRELTSLFATLARVPLAEAPLDLGRSTLADIVASSERGSSRATGNPFLGSWRAQMMRRPALSLAMPFAAGLAIGVLALGVWTGSFGPGPARDRTDTAGSMSPDAGAESAAWTLGGSQISARSWSAGGSRFASIEVRNPQGLTLELSFDPSLVHPVALSQSGPGSGEASLALDGAMLKPRGNATYLLEFRPAAPDAPIRVTMRSSRRGSESEPDALVGLLPVPNTSSHGR